jgi:hypothetical protein
VPAFQDDVETGDAHLAWFFFYPARAPLYESGDPLPWIQLYLLLGRYVGTRVIRVLCLGGSSTSSSLKQLMKKKKP